MKCMICGKEVEPTSEYTVYNDRWQINGAVLGEYIEIQGHKECCAAVDRLVIWPNRARVNAAMK